MCTVMSAKRKIRLTLHRTFEGANKSEEFLYIAEMLSKSIANV